MESRFRDNYLPNPCSSRGELLTPLRLRFRNLYCCRVELDSVIWKEYLEIQPHIRSITDDPEIGTVLQVHHTLCLVGPSEGRVRPAIALYSPCSSYLSRVVDRIKESPEWRSFVSRRPLFCLIRSKKAP